MKIKNWIEDIILDIGIRLRLKGNIDEWLTGLFWKRQHKMVKEICDKIKINAKDITIKPL